MVPSADTTENLQDYSSQDASFSLEMEEDLFGEPAPHVPHDMPVPVFQTDFRTDALPINFESALIHFDGDRTFMMEMLKEYKDHLPERRIEIQTALQAGDVNRLARLAHNLKGVSLNFSADLVADIALRLEEMGKREDLAQAPALIAKLDEEIRRVEEFLSKNL